MSLCLCRRWVASCQMGGLQAFLTNIVLISTKNTVHSYKKILDIYKKQIKLCQPECLQKKLVRVILQVPLSGLATGL